MDKNKNRKMEFAGKSSGSAKSNIASKSESNLVKQAAKVGMRDYRNTLRRLAK